MKYNREFEHIDTQEKAYVLGYFYGDGCNYKGRSGNYSCYCSKIISRDLDIVLKIKQAFPFFYYRESIHHTKPLYEISKSSKLLYEDLLKWNVYPRKSTDNREHLKIPNIDTKLIPHFIRGLYDSDGGFYLYGTLLESFFCSTSETLTLELKSWFKQKGVKVNLSIKRREGYIDLYWLRSKSSDYNKILTKLLYQDATIFLDRKKFKIDQADFNKQDVKNSRNHAKIKGTDAQKQRLLKDYRLVIEKHENIKDILKPSVCCQYHTVQSGKSYKKNCVRPLNLCLKCGKKSVFLADVKQD